MDWIVALPVSEEGYDSILVCVERITKFAPYFIASKSTDTAQDTLQKDYLQRYFVYMDHQ